MFALKVRNEKDLQRIFKHYPVLFAKASGDYLSLLSGGTWEKAREETIPHLFTMRKKAFVQGRVRFKKSHGRSPISSQKSETGAVQDKPRYSSLVEAESGKRTKRKRVFQRAGRIGGNKKKQARSLARLKPGKSFFNPNTIKPKGDKGAHHRAVVMLAILDRRNYKEPFMVWGHKNMRKGLYKRVRGKVRMLQNFESKNLQPKRLKWLSIASKGFMNELNEQAVWHLLLHRRLPRGAVGRPSLTSAKIARLSRQFRAK